MWIRFSRNKNKFSDYLRSDAADGQEEKKSNARANNR